MLFICYPFWIIQSENKKKEKRKERNVFEFDFA